MGMRLALGLLAACAPLARAFLPTLLVRNHELPSGSAVLSSASGELDAFSDPEHRQVAFGMALQDEEAGLGLGAYGEFPPAALTSVFEDMPVVATMLALEQGATFVDIGSGRGRLLPTAAACEWCSDAVGIEAGLGLHGLALATAKGHLAI